MTPDEARRVIEVSNDRRRVGQAPAYLQLLNAALVLSRTAADGISIDTCLRLAQEWGKSAGEQATWDFLCVIAEKPMTAEQANDFVSACGMVHKQQKTRTWTVNHETGDIRYSGPRLTRGGPRATIAKFAEWLREQDVPVIRHPTSYVLQLPEPYNIDAATAERISDGTLSQRGADGRLELFQSRVIYEDKS